MTRDPFWLPMHPSEEQRDRFWRKLGKFARGKKSTVLVGVKY